MKKKMDSALIVDSVFKDHSNYRIELGLIKQDDPERTYSAILTGSWFQTNVDVGDKVNIKGNTNANGVIEINDKENGSIVVLPDELISITSVASAAFCARKSWLNETFRGLGPGNKSMLIGSIVHDLFQKACMDRFDSETQLEDYLKIVLKDGNILNNCLILKIQESQLFDEVKEYIPHIHEWCQQFIFNGPGPLKDETKRVSISNIHDIEDNIWSPTYGLKGKVDLTVEASFVDSGKQTITTLPLELKTGNPSYSNEHIAQVNLYSLMMSEQNYFNHINGGLIVYLKDGPQMKYIHLKPQVKNGLIQLRNEVAKSRHEFEIGPDFKGDQRLCSKCDNLLACSMVLKSYDEEKLNNSKVMSELADKSTSHLTNTHIQFFKKWISLMHMEAAYSQGDPKESFFWNESSVDSELKGTCIGNLIIDEIDGFIYKFKRNSSKFNQEKFPTTSSLLQKGDRVVLSIDEDENLLAVTSGMIKQLRDDVFEVEVKKHPNSRLLSLNFRVDLMKYSAHYSTDYSNMLQLMSPTAKSAKLRKIIIDKEVPSFHQRFSSEIVAKGKSVIKGLNRLQVKAVLRALSANEYFLVHGMPGCGKTQTIVGYIRLAVTLNKSVLVTSHTHAAVDNILLKLKKFNIDFIRIGSSSRIHPDLLEYSLESLLKKETLNSTADLKKLYDSKLVVAATCLAISSNSLFQTKKFDYCIMDEASQIILPASLGPLFISDKFLLIGDPKQLTPVVRCKEAKEYGFDESLFSLLQTTDNVVKLRSQYRMNSSIMRIANSLTYNMILKCGSPEIANSTLQTPKHSSIYAPWLEYAGRGGLEYAVLFLDTDCIPAYENKDNISSISNEIEANIVKQLIEMLLTTQKDLEEKDIGILTPYRAQIRKIKEKINRSTHLEISTIDQFQGRDKTVIIFSCVRSFLPNQIPTITANEILSDEKRLNVALTRAKKKLILIGSKSSLEMYIPFNRLFKILNENEFHQITDFVFST